MKTILLTGARGGIGSFIASSLETAGHNVIRIDHAETNLSSYDDIQQLEKKLGNEGVRLDWIVCAHGFIDAEGDIEKQRPEDIATIFQVNIISIAYLAQLFLQHLNPGGGMIALSSTAALTANGRHAVYSASKGAVNVFMQALTRNRPEFSFVSICPGPTNTSMREKIATGAATSQDPAVVAKVVEDIVDGQGTYISGDIVAVRNGETSIVQHLT